MIDNLIKNSQSLDLRIIISYSGFQISARKNIHLSVNWFVRGDLLYKRLVSTGCIKYLITPSFDLIMRHSIFIRNWRTNTLLLISKLWLRVFLRCLLIGLLFNMDNIIFIMVLIHGLQNLVCFGYYLVLLTRFAAHLWFHPFLLDFGLNFII